jgi:hypothetical protein
VSRSRSPDGRRYAPPGGPRDRVPADRPAPPDRRGRVRRHGFSAPASSSWFRVGREPQAGDGRSPRCWRASLRGETARTVLRLSRRSEDFTATTSLLATSLPADRVTVRLDKAGAVDAEAERACLKRYLAMEHEEIGQRRASRGTSSSCPRCRNRRSPRPAARPGPAPPRCLQPGRRLTVRVAAPCFLPAVRELLRTAQRKRARRRCPGRMAGPRLCCGPRHPRTMGGRINLASHAFVRPGGES